MGDVLISCAPADRSRVDALAKAFIDEGHRVGWRHEALWSLAREVCVVAVWSRHSSGEQWLANLARGSARRGKLVSIRLDQSSLPRGLKRHRIVDLSMWPARSADGGVDRLLAITAEVSSQVATTSRQAQSKYVVAVLVGGVLSLIVAGIWWADAGPTNEASRSSQPHPPSVSPAGEARSGDFALGIAAPPTDVADPLPEPMRTAIEKPVNEAQFLGDLALEQLAAAMAGDASMMISARSNAERALVSNPTEPAARLAIGVLLIAMDLDWQQGHQLITHAASGGDERLAPLARRLLQMYGEGEVIAEGRTCDDEWVARSRAFVDLAPAARLELIGSDCFLMLTHGDSALRAALGIDHE